MGLIYVLTGTEAYGIKTALNKLIDKYIEPDWADFNLEYLEPQTTEAAELVDKWVMPPFGGDCRVLVIDIPERQADKYLEEMTQKLEGLPEHHNVLIVSTVKLDKRKKWVKALLKQATHQDFEPIKPWNIEKELYPWIEEHLRQKEFRISYDALGALTEGLGVDKHALAQGLEKICVYLGEPQVIQLEHVTLLVNPVKSDIFKLLDLLALKQLGPAQEQLQRLLLQDKPGAILAGLGSQLQQIYRAKSLLALRWSQADIAKNIGMNPYRLKKVLAQWQKYSVKELGSKLRRLVELDAFSKQGKFAQEWALELWICECVTPQKKM